MSTAASIRQIADGSWLLLRAAEAARLCGTSVRTWRNWDIAGKIPQPVRVGRKIFWRPEELKAWIAAGCPDRLTWEAIRE
jgi:predicted DNA-binding transcriptional regulator AlpA